MLTLSRAKASAGSAGEVIPTVFRQLDGAGVRFRRGQLHLIAAASGVGKSVIALRLALEAGVPALYISADTDAWTMSTRAAAMRTGHRLDDIETAYSDGNGAYYDEALGDIENVAMTFAPNPNLDDIDSEFEAFASKYGEWPHLAVIDNLSNVWAGGDETGNSVNVGLEGTLEQLHVLSRKTGTCFVILHHVVGAHVDGNEPVPVSGLMGKVDKKPEVVLTVHRTQPGFLGVFVGKNRSGKVGAVVEIPFTPERMQVG